MSVVFFEQVTGDLLKLLPRAMGHFIYQNRYDFGRGFTFMTRDILHNPLKEVDREEVRRNSYARLMRDIPYAVKAFEGGDIKLDTSAGNLAGRLGMIAYSIISNKLPACPDVDYLERISTGLVNAVGDNQFDLFLYFDGYADFHSLGELMERLKDDQSPAFRHVRNDRYAGRMKEYLYSQFNPPDKFERMLVMTDAEMNALYSDIINSVVDAYVFIWRTSGMELRHPSYMAPPGTIIKRNSKRTLLSGGAVTKPSRAAREVEAPEPEEASESKGPGPGAEGTTVAPGGVVE